MKNESDMSKSVFISYAREDFNIAKKLFDDLNDSGIKAWLDKENILPGQNWRSTIIEAIEKCSYFIFLLSENSVSKQGFVQKELKTALNILDNYPDNDIFIIPVRIEHCMPFDKKISELQWVDLFPSFEKGFLKILRVFFPDKDSFQKAVNSQNAEHLNYNILSSWINDKKINNAKLISITSNEPLSPFLVYDALLVMGTDEINSGVGVIISDFGSPLEEIKDIPIIVGLVTKKALNRLDEFISDIGFINKFDLSFSGEKLSYKESNNILFLIRAYDYPETWEKLSQNEKNERLFQIQNKLIEFGEERSDMKIFSFWPNVIILKFHYLKHFLFCIENIGKYISGRIILAQNNISTGDLYSFQPSFMRGFSTLVDGIPSYSVKLNAFLGSMGYPIKSNYSNNYVFSNILHYTVSNLNLPIEMYKHIINPLNSDQILRHPNGQFLNYLKKSCRNFFIDGPKCVIGCLPNNTLFMVQDNNKGVVGGRPGLFMISSDISGLDAVIPDRDKSRDFQTMHLDTVIIDSERESIKVCSQLDELIM